MCSTLSIDSELRSKFTKKEGHVSDWLKCTYTKLEGLDEAEGSIEDKSTDNGR